VQLEAETGYASGEWWACFFYFCLFLCVCI